MGSDVVVLAFAGGLIFVALVAMGFMLKRRAHIVRALRDDTSFLEDLRDDHLVKPSLARAVCEHLVRETRDGRKRVLSKPLADLRREWAEGEVAHHWSFWLGGLLTGVALIATFLLIAQVMTSDVSGAISESVGSDEKSSTGHLADAVSLLGGKFMISAAGVLASVLSLALANWIRGDIYRRAEHPDLQLSSRFVSLEEYEHTTRLEELVEDRDIRAAQHRELTGHLAALHQGIEKLGSIEVSVKTIGNEVSANLKNIMKDAMGEQLRGMLSDTMADVAKMADAVQQNLSDSFGSQLHKLTTELQKSLASLQSSIDGQSQGQLEKILDQLQNTVSGGFQNESRSMAEALDRFARVVPALEEQLRAMTGKVAEDARRQGEEHAQQSQAVMARVGLLLEAMDSQQRANAEAIERIQRVSQQGAEAMAQRLEASGAGLVSNVLGASRAEIEAIVGQLRTAAEASSSRYGHIETQAATIASAIASSTEALKESAVSVIQVANQAASSANHAKAGGDAMHTAAAQFLQAGNTLLGSVTKTHEVIELARAQTRDQQALLERQADYTKEVEKLWPQLFDTYLVQFKHGADELGRSWKKFHDDIATVTSTVGATFADNTEVLADNVDKLLKLARNGAST